MKKRTKKITVEADVARVLEALGSKIKALETERSSLEHQIELLNSEVEAGHRIIASLSSGLESVQKWSNVSAAIAQTDLQALTRPKD